MRWSVFSFLITNIFCVMLYEQHKHFMCVLPYMNNRQNKSLPISHCVFTNFEKFFSSQGSTSQSTGSQARTVLFKTASPTKSRLISKISSTEESDLEVAVSESPKHSLIVTIENYPSNTKPSEYCVFQVF